MLAGTISGWPSGWATAFTVLFTPRNAMPNRGTSQIKVHRAREAYERERDVYLRLKEAGVEEILGFAVPKLIRSDDELLVIEMTIVTCPFVLDFAGAYLDSAPQFSDEIWSEWEVEKRDQFESWPEVQAALAALEELDIYMVDVSPSNIAFLD
jgi:hypothetical protein